MFLCLCIFFFSQVILSLIYQIKTVLIQLCLVAHDSPHCTRGACFVLCWVQLLTDVKQTKVYFKLALLSHVFLVMLQRSPVELSAACLY